jgi:serine protease Do
MRLSIWKCLTLSLLASVCWTPSSPAQEKSGKNLLLALEDSLQEVIKKTENSVACILVSRSDIYRTVYEDKPPAGQPYKLGAFDPAGRSPPQTNQMNQFRGRGRFNQPPPDQVGARRFDLSYSGYIPESYGSGLVIDGERLLILTPYHVIRDATKIYVRLPGNKGSYADIHATDPQRDLAVIVLIDKSIKPLQAVKFGDGSAVKKGQFVVTLANPHASGFRDGSPSASWGIVSNIQRRAAARTSDADAAIRPEANTVPTFTTGDYIRTDAQIMEGSSGGALLNLNGEVIGLISARAALSGLEGNGGFAMPINKETRAHIESLREGKEVEHGFLGISSDPENKRGEGAIVGDVRYGSPAQLAGISPHDCIVAVNGTPVFDFDDLVLAVSALKAGSEARLELRGRQPPIVTVKLGKSYVPGVIASNRPEPVRGIRVDYATVGVQRKRLETLHQESFSPHGVSVSEVIPQSPADNAKLQVFAVITEVNGQRVDNPAEFYAAANKVPAGQPLVLTLPADTQRTREDQKVVIP